jgi:hypothetical protein
VSLLLLGAAIRTYIAGLMRVSSDQSISCQTHSLKIVGKAVVGRWATTEASLEATSLGDRFEIELISKYHVLGSWLWAFLYNTLLLDAIKEILTGYQY